MAHRLRPAPSASREPPGPSIDWVKSFEQETARSSACATNRRPSPLLASTEQSGARLRLAPAPESICLDLVCNLFPIKRTGRFGNHEGMVQCCPPFGNALETNGP